MAKKEQDRVKIWFLLDRSGSMAPVAEDVIGGFNHFLTNQADQAGELRAGQEVAIPAWAADEDGGGSCRLLPRAARLGPDGRPEPTRPVLTTRAVSDPEDRGPRATEAGVLGDDPTEWTGADS